MFFRTILSILCWPLLPLDLISAINQNRKLKSEQPKLIAEHNKWKTFGICFVHLLPIAITAFLLVLNLSNVWYEPVEGAGQNARFNAFQFAAKVHEVLMVASLSAIVLNYVQYEIIHGIGVPFGIMLAGFEVANVSLLWAPGLWATAFADGMKARRLRLVALIVLMVLLGAIVGPASAILMLPSLGYWDFQSVLADMGWGNNSESFHDPRFYIGANASTLWPQLINTDSYPPNCNSATSPIPEYCPLGGLSVLLNLANPTWTGIEGWNFTMEFSAYNDSVYNRYMEGYSSPFSESSYNSITRTTSLFADHFLVAGTNDGLLNQFDVRIGLSLSNGSQIQFPAVYTICNDTELWWVNGSLHEGAFISNGGGGDTRFEDLGILSELKFPVNESMNWSSDASPLLAVWNNLASSATIWVESPDLSESTPSIGVAFAVFADNVSPSTQSHAADIVTCSIYASWELAEPYIEPFRDNFVHAASIDFGTYGRGPGPMLVDPANYYINKNYMRPIKFDINWANSALPPNYTIGNLAREINSKLSTEAGASTSIFVADVISRLGVEKLQLVAEHDSNLSTSLNTNQPPVPIAANNITEFKFIAQRYGYSYSIEGLTRRIAAGILLTHALIATIYMILIIWFRWSCHGLRSIYEVVVLAMNSPPNKMSESTSAGISRLDTYKHIVKVRELSNTRLGLVLDDDGQMDPPVNGKLYGSL